MAGPDFLRSGMAEISVRRALFREISDMTRESGIIGSEKRVKR
jgi:hypothetical protein